MHAIQILSCLVGWLAVCLSPIECLGLAVRVPHSRGSSTSCEAARQTVMQTGWTEGKVRENRTDGRGKEDAIMRPDRPPARVIQDEENEVVQSA